MPYVRPLYSPYKKEKKKQTKKTDKEKLAVRIKKKMK